MKHAIKFPSRATSAAGAMGAHKCSHAIAKAPPRKIRIVHVLAPEVIKTDPRHFRDLVQRLTGKPSAAAEGGGGGGGGASVSDSAAATKRESCDKAGGGVAVAVAVAAPAPAATVKPVVKVEKDEAEPLLRAFGEEENNDVFFQGLEDFLFSSCNVDALSF